MTDSINFRVSALTQSDRERVLEISAQIWEGEDYIPLVFDQWVKQENSDFVGLWVDDKLIAFNRLVYLTPNDVWLEGLRKDQSCRYKGITKYLLDYHLKNIKNNPQVETIRFSTYFTNFASIVYHEKRGFKKILELSHLELESEYFDKFVLGNSSNVKVEITDLNEEILDYISTSKFIKLSDNHITDSWTVYPSKNQYLEQFLKEKKLLVIRKSNQIVAAAAFTLGKEQKTFWINFLEAESLNCLKILLAQIALQAKEQGLNSLEIVAPGNWFNLKQIGFKSWEQNNDFWLYELEK